MKKKDSLENKLRNKEERYFYYYLLELHEKGLIKEIEYEEEEFVLSTQILYTKEIVKKTKTVIKSFTLLRPHKYTVDFTFKIEPNHYILKKIFTIISKDISKVYIDVKGQFARNLSTAITFPLNQKWVFSKYGIYVEKAVPFNLFEKTFTPKRVIKEEVYKRDGKHGKIGDSKLKYDPITIETFLKTFEQNGEQEN